jgi:hypothetical protein
VVAPAMLQDGAWTAAEMDRTLVAIVLEARAPAVVGLAAPLLSG